MSANSITRPNLKSPHAHHRPRKRYFVRNGNLTDHETLYHMNWRASTYLGGYLCWFSDYVTPVQFSDNVTP